MRRKGRGAAWCDVCRCTQSHRDVRCDATAIDQKISFRDIIPPLTTPGLLRTCNTTHSTVRQAITECDRGRPPWRACGRQRGSALGRTPTHIRLGRAGRARGVSRARRTCGSRRGSPQPGSRAAAPAGAQPPPPPRALQACPYVPSYTCYGWNTADGQRVRRSFNCRRRPGGCASSVGRARMYS